MAALLRTLLLFLATSAFAQIPGEGVFVGASELEKVQLPSIGFTSLGWTNITTGYLDYPTVNSFTVTANQLAMCVAVSSKTAPAAAPTNVVGLGMSWTNIAGTNFGANVNHISVWISKTNATTPSGTVTAKYAATMSGGCVYVCQITNFATVPIVQTVMLTNEVSNPSITLAGLSGGRNAVIATFGAVRNGALGTPEAGFTEDADISYNTPATALYFMHSTGTGDNTPSVVQSTAYNWGGIAFEIGINQ